MFDVEIDTSEIERAWPKAVAAIAEGINQGVERGVEAGAEQARTSHPYQDRTGALTGSIRGYLERAAVRGAGGEAVGVLEAKAKHAGFVESGTAPHIIEPRNARALHFESGGEDVFAKLVHHPGTPSMPFMGPAVLKAERVMEMEIEVATERAARIMDD